MVFNMGFHAAAWVEIAEREGVPGLPTRLFEQELAGLKNVELIPRALKRELSIEAIARIAQDKEERYRTSYRGRMEPAPGLVAFLDRLEGAGIPRAVATAAPEGNRQLVLDGLALRGRFHAIIGAEQVQRGKPAPDIFLAAIAALGVPPEHCVIFEDAPNGVRAAVDAGALCVGVLSTTPAERLLDEGAVAVLDTFDPLPADVESLVFGR